MGVYHPFDKSETATMFFSLKTTISSFKTALICSFKGIIQCFALNT